MAVFCRADQRRRNFEQMRATTAASRSRPSASPLEGVDDINAHISQVHDDLIADKGLAFIYDQHIESGDCLLRHWSMLAPSGVVVGRGIDLVFRNADGRVQRVYMFMGAS